MEPKRAFVALQDRYVSALAVACCPTMDLVAVITLDRHLLVHRTTSWQKLMHIKPSEVGFEMVTLAWSPDGLQLAVGCDEGDVALFDIESCEMVPERRCCFRHEHCITAMHWTAISAVENNHNSGKHQPDSINDWTSRSSSQSKQQFQQRASRFLPGFNEPSGQDSVLVTADTDGQIAIWWRGNALLTHVDVRKYFKADEERILKSLGHSNDRSGFRIDRVDVAPDLSLLFVLVGFGEGPNPEETKAHRMLTLDLTCIQAMYGDVKLVADTVDRVDILVNRIVTTGKKMATEWKNATRIFELKMGLIGSLYEKYACEDPPQVDMLSVVVSGITVPALAQYFSQDIQEMSVNRMQKALNSGCDTLGTLADEKLKCDSVELIFLLSELRSHAKWNPVGYSDTLGITVTALDGMVDAAQEMLIATEVFTLALYETRQDFSQFLMWILDRIRAHTSSSEAGQGINRSNSRDSNAESGAKSLLDIRRLCDFLQRAADAAHRFQKQQPSYSKFKVETTFGNLVSQQLSARPAPVGDNKETKSQGCLVLSERIQTQWRDALQLMTATLASTINRDNNGCFTVGCSSNSVQECHVRFRRPFDAHRNNDITDEDPDSESEGDDDEVVDWASLKHFGRPIRDDHNGCMALIGLRLQSDALLLVRVLRNEDFPRQAGCPSLRLSLDAVVIRFSQSLSSKAVGLAGFDFYGDVSSKKDEQLAVVLQRTISSQTPQEWLCLQRYDHVKFSKVEEPHLDVFERLSREDSTHTLELKEVRGRVVAPSSALDKMSRNKVSVVAIASRGTLCVMIPPSRLVVLDAEDSEDDDEDNDAEEGE